MERKTLVIPLCFLLRWAAESPFEKAMGEFILPLLESEISTSPFISTAYYRWG